jgi:hypothetical protein
MGDKLFGFELVGVFAVGRDALSKRFREYYDSKLKSDQLKAARNRTTRLSTRSSGCAGSLKPLV